MIRDPLTVSPETAIRIVLNSMHQGTGVQSVEPNSATLLASGCSSCVIVVDQGSVVGILTERDVVRLAAQGRLLEGEAPIQTVMTAPVITLSEADFTCIEVAETLFQRHPIRHLPVVDHDQQLVGLLTRDGVRSLLLAPSRTEVGERETDWRDRHATWQALQTQRDFNRLIAEIASRFVDLGPDSLDAEIERTLQLIGEATQVDTSYLVQFSTPTSGTELNLGQRTLTMTHEWCQTGWPRQIRQVQAIPLAAFPWANTRLLQREIVYVPDVNDLPAEASIDQANWQQFNLRSVLSVPLIKKSVVTGLLGFASFRQSMAWDEEAIRLLQVMGQAIANIQERIQTEQNLHVSEERLRLALSAANQGLYDLNLQTGDAIVNSEYALMLGYNPITFRENNTAWLARLHPDDLERVAATYQAYISGTIPDYQVEFRQRTQTGDYKWILSLGKIVAWDADGHPLRMLGTHTDISDRKQAEAERLKIEQTRQELKLLEQVLDIVLAGYWDWDIPHQQEYLSPGFKRMFGYADDELPNTPESWQRLIFPEDLPSVLACFDRHVQSRGEVPYDNEVRYRHKDGSTVWVACSGQVIEWDAAGNPLRMIGCHINITQRKQAEATLQKTKEELEEFFLVALDLLCIADMDGRFRRLNRSWETTLGYTIEDLEGKSFVDLIHPDDVESTLAAISTLEQQETVHAFVNRYRRKDGTYRYIEWYSRPRGYLIYAAARDITEQRLVEQRLRKSETHLKTAQRIGKLGSWEFNVQTGEINWSDEVFRMFGRNPAEGPPSYEELQQLYLSEDQLYHDQVVQTALETRQPYELECRARRPDGSLIYIQARGEPIFDEAGHLIQLVGTVLDITARKQAEAQLLQTTAQLEASNRELEAFAYSVSHDLRSPLRAIDGFSKALLEDYGDTLDADAQDYFQRIRNNVTRMGMLIDDLLRLSRVSRSDMHYGSVDLSALAQEICQELQESEPERQVAWAIAPHITVHADTTLMRVVLTNLLQNAWKFTSHHPTARIEFGCLSLDRQPTYFVRDDGAGFDMAYANKLFGVFQRLHNMDEFPGTGIGLATVQRAIHRHGGNVWAEAAVEQGATIYFTLPPAYPDK